LQNVLNELIDSRALLFEDENKYVNEALYIAQALKRGQLLTSDAVQRKAAEQLKLKAIFVT